ncbi:hypothetical protein RF11_00493 [Thelohanellus kitauei]|uniref:Transmembrane protein n=1 Tax=Thelohanellus kitauei TaxID=669202 RepID=A0A0C2JH46_THEKT|nr:hypothetical protein RF11_00493 [Thelohanellus kitauei]
MSYNIQILYNKQILDSVLYRFEKENIFIHSLLEHISDVKCIILQNIQYKKIYQQTVRIFIVECIWCKYLIMMRIYSKIFSKCCTLLTLISIFTSSLIHEFWFI